MNLSRIFFYTSILFFFYSKCYSQLIPIFEIQGSTPISSYSQQIVNTEGVVTAVFPQLDGYFIQDKNGDGNVATSDGIFVYDTSNIPQVGEELLIGGTIDEYYEETQLKRITRFDVLSTGNVIVM